MLQDLSRARPQSIYDVEAVENRMRTEERPVAFAALHGVLAFGGLGFGAERWPPA